MGKLRGFLEFDRVNEGAITVKERVKNYKEFTTELPETTLSNQGARCMDCGIPFCHSGCPLGNLIPDFNDAVYKNDWHKALRILHATNNFPEFTGRLCPAPCESACVLGIVNPPVSIELIEKYIVERGFKEGWIKADPPKFKTGKKIGIVGSGPAGLAAAQQLNRAGHTVTVFERDNKVGGLLRYGIPDFKLEKSIIDRRVAILKEEGIVFKTNTHVGINYKIDNLKKFDAIVLCGGSTTKRALNITGSDAHGIVQAMDFLKYNNLVVDNLEKPIEKLSAKGKNVIVVGGGDTGSDCIGTSNRQGAKSVTNFEIMPMPPEFRSNENPWPFWPFTLKTSSSHEEGCDRNWSVLTKEFIKDKAGHITGLKTIEVKQEFTSGKPGFSFKEIQGTEKVWNCDLVLLALGFTGPEKTLSDQLALKINKKNTIAATNYKTNASNIFTAGDMHRGQSLIVWAISEGREVAHQVDAYLMGSSNLPVKGLDDLPSVN